MCRLFPTFIHNPPLNSHYIPHTHPRQPHLSTIFKYKTALRPPVGGLGQVLHRVKLC